MRGSWLWRWRLKSDNNLPAVVVVVVAASTMCVIWKAVADAPVRPSLYALHTHIYTCTCIFLHTCLHRETDTHRERERERKRERERERERGQDCFDYSVSGLQQPLAGLVAFCVPLLSLIFLNNSSASPPTLFEIDCGQASTFSLQALHLCA